MKKYAITLLVVPLLFLGMLVFGPDKADHESSPAFSAALSNAIDRLEGAAIKATVAATPCAQAEAFDLTTDPITCDASPQCGGLTADHRPCYTLQDEEPTCDQQSETCDQGMTCHGRYTCDERTTCTGGPTCDGTYTCWNSTCDQPDMTCDNTPTCDGGVDCDFTVDGSHTCNGVPTCESTCEAWPTCEYTCQGAVTCDGSPTCTAGGITCDPSSPTCMQTCVVWPTCQASPECGITYDGTPTCTAGMYTCESTCQDWPTCGMELTCIGYGAQTCEIKPECAHGTERTSWGGIKKKFK